MLLWSLLLMMCSFSLDDISIILQLQYVCVNWYLSLRIAQLHLWRGWHALAVFHVDFIPIAHHYSSFAAVLTLEYLNVIALLEELDDN